MLDARLVDAHVGWAVTARRVVRTSDNGGTWTNVTPSGLAIVFEPPDPSSGDATSHTNVIGADFVDAGHADLATAIWHTGTLTLTVWRTADAGATWTQSVLPPLKGVPAVIQTNISPDAWNATLAFPDATHGYVYLIQRAGGLVGPGAYQPAFAFRTVDGGRSWIKLPLGAWGSQFAFSGPLRGWSGQQGGAFFTTSDGGQSWSKVTLPGLQNLQDLGWPAPIIWSTHLIAVHPSDSAQRNPIYVELTQDAGQTWHLITRNLPPWVGDIDLIGPDTWIAPYLVDRSVAGITLTQDAGLTWSRPPPQSATNAVAGAYSLNFPDVVHGWSLVWVSQARNDLYKTDDGGLNWKRLNP